MKPFRFIFSILFYPLHSLENKLVFFPIKHDGLEYQEAFAIYSPEDVFFSSTDGTQLHGWYFEHPNPDHYLVMFHGNGGNILHTLGTIDRFRQVTNASIFTFDYRGYGHSEGAPFETDVISDSKAARDWLCNRAGVQPNQIIYYGSSLGGAVAIDLAAKDPPKGLIVKGTFSTLPRVAAYHHKILTIFGFIMRNRFHSLSKIKKYQGPFLQIHGTADTIVPFHFAEELFAVANEPKELIVLKEEGHNGFTSQTTENCFLQATESFLQELNK